MPVRNHRKAIRRLLVTFLLLYIFFALIPAAVFGTLKARDSIPYSSIPREEETGSISSAPPEFLQGAGILSQAGEPYASAEEFHLYDEDSGQVLAVPDESFLPGALACEMDLSAPREALKAQAVAIYTLYCKKRDEGAGTPGTEIPWNSKAWQIYVTPEAMEERWGEDFQDNFNLLQEVSREVAGEFITYEGEPVLSTYFAISAGCTENAENVWSQDASLDHPYLHAVASPGDMLSPGYLSTVSFTEEEFKAALSQHFREESPDFSQPFRELLKLTDISPSGYVVKAELGGTEVSGTELRTALSLRSHAFDISFGESDITFTVRGWGHGAGMSQAGAAFMANQGADYREILAYYYPGTTIASPK